MSHFSKGDAHIAINTCKVLTHKETLENWPCTSMKKRLPGPRLGWGGSSSNSCSGHSDGTVALENCFKISRKAEVIHIL